MTVDMIPNHNIEQIGSIDSDAIMAHVNDTDENIGDTSRDDIISMDVTAEETNSLAVNSPRPDRTSSDVVTTGNSTTCAPAVTPYHQRSMTPSTTSNSMSSSSSTSANKVATPSEEPAVTTPLLSLYYQHLFPYDFLYQWFRYGTGTAATNAAGGTTTGSTATANRHMNLFYHREFSFTIPNPHTAEEIYIRYQSFSHIQDFQRAIQKRLPIKIDIGAIFSHPPVQKSTLATGATSSFQPIEREFVLDIDLTDYDDVRNCGCQAANICPICWKYMYMAMDTIQMALQDDFQFQHIQWFYSGRRGIHGWVCDATARSLTDSGRTAIANYLTVDLGNEKNQDVHLSYPLHPYIHRAYKILEPYFIRDVIVSKKHGGHGLLCDADQYRKVLNLLPDCAVAVRETLEDKWSTQSVTPLEKWNDLKKHVSIYAKQLDERFSKKAKNAQNNSLEEEKIREKNRQLLDLFCVEVVLRYTYPRLDINVSKMRNHLLKSPFCVHPKTGRVCVPISKTEHRTFDPFAVPTISQIVQEYFVATKAESAVTTSAATDNNDNQDDITTTNTVPNADNHETKSPNLKWEHTSLKPYYTKFQKEFLIPLMKESQLQQRHNVTDRKEAEQLDF